MKVIDGFKVGFKPSDADLVGAYEPGYQFGYLVQSKKPGTATARGGRRLVKCLARGETFDSSIEIRLICGVDRENFVPVENAANDFTNSMASDYLVLGSGVVGLNAAKAIRERGATGRITMVSEEPHPSYNRPMLTKSLVIGLEPEQIAMVDAPWYEENQVHQMPGKRVESVDMDARQALLDDRTKLHFMKLIYALGSECFTPSMGGSGLPEVVAIRRLSDVRRVEALMKSAEKVVVAGGSVLGLEVAWELKKAGLEVTVLEMAPSLMGRQVDESPGEQSKIMASKTGVVIRTGVNVEATEEDGRVNDVHLKTGEVAAAGMVIMSASIRANIELAKKMGSETKRGVVVNERMETSVSGIYAYGDYAQYHDGNYGIRSEAMEQGKTAGANTAGDSPEYTLVPAALTFHGMNTALFATGDNGRNPNLYYRTVEFRDMGKEQYQKYYFLNSRMSDVILVGGLSRMAAMTEATENHVTYQEVMENQADVYWTQNNMRTIRKGNNSYMKVVLGVSQCYFLYKNNYCALPSFSVATTGSFGNTKLRIIASKGVRITLFFSSIAAIPAGNWAPAPLQNWVPRPNARDTPIIKQFRLEYPASAKSPMPEVAIIADITTVPPSITQLGTVDSTAPTLGQRPVRKRILQPTRVMKREHILARATTPEFWLQAVVGKLLSTTDIMEVILSAVAPPPISSGVGSRFGPSMYDTLKSPIICTAIMK